MNKVLKFHVLENGQVIFLTKDYEKSNGGVHSIYIGTDKIEGGIKLAEARNIFNWFKNNYK